MGERPTLDVTDPGIAAQLYDTDPRQVQRGRDNNTKFAWRCPNHPEPYIAVLTSRIHRNTGCPYCKNMKVLPGFNDLATRYPDLAAELVDADPTQVLAGGNAVHKWRCPNHDEPYSTRVKARIDGHGCRYCNHIEALPGYNDLATTHPDIAAEAIDVDPTTVLYGTRTMVTWRCPRGHTYQATVNARTGTHHTGCPYCAGRKVWVGFNDLATTHPDLAAQLVDVDPTTVSAGSNKTVIWRCPAHGHEFDARILNRTATNSTGCPYCSGYKTYPGFNDLATTHPELASELLSPDPTTVSAGSKKRGTWRCPNHDEPYTAPVNARTSHQSGCSYCSGRAVLAGFNDIATTHPELAAQLRDEDPTTVLAGTSRKLWWRCPAHGHEYQMAGDSRVNAGRNCPYCSGKRVLAGFNDLATTDPDLADELIGTDPTSITRGSSRRLTWQCRRCGKKWKSIVSNRTGVGSGCPTCSPTGYDPHKPGYLYLMARPGEQQVGITNYPQKRLRTHAKQGWELLDVTDAMNGQRVFDVELVVRRWLRAQQWALDGTAENWSTANLEVSTLRELFDAAGVTDPATGTTPSG